jgi:photosystem II stability/assembly factor-like uncharacterized protein
VSRTLRSLWGVHALSGAHAWVVGERGTVLRTVDGGAVWQQQIELSASFQQAMYAVQFVDRSRGWIVGALGLILHTEDGGVTWELQQVKCIPALSSPRVGAVSSSGQRVS